MAGEELNDMFSGGDEGLNQNPDDQAAMGDGQDQSQIPGGQEGNPDSAPPSGAPTDELASLRQQLNESQAAIAYLKGRIEAGAPSQGEKDGEKAPDESVSYWTPEEMQALADGDMSHLGTGITRAMKAMQTSMMQALPQMVESMMDTKITTQATTEQFFATHKGLNTETGRVVLRHISGQLAKQNPGWSLNQILDTASKQAYKDLNLSPPGSTTPPRTPAQGGAGGRSGGAPARRPQTGKPNSATEQVNSFFDED